MFRHLFFTNRILRARNASLRCTRVATHQKPQRVQFLNVPKPPSESSRLDGSADRCNQLTITGETEPHQSIHCFKNTIQVKAVENRRDENVGGCEREKSISYCERQH